jgi:hypothetical protein
LGQNLIREHRSPAVHETPQAAPHIRLRAASTRATP